MKHEELLEQLRSKAREGQTPAQLLCYMAIDLKMEGQVDIMQAFADAFNTNLGSVTAIGGWWYEEPRELNDEDVNAYMKDILDEFLNV